MICYFAYGSNMNLKQMKKRCPSAEFLKAVRLDEYMFVYDGYSSNRKGAVANIVPKKDSHVFGALFQVNENCLSQLDCFESCPSSYQRQKIKVKGNEGKDYEAWVYLRSPKKRGVPSIEYRCIVLEGGRDIADCRRNI